MNCFKNRVSHFSSANQKLILPKSGGCQRVSFNSFPSRTLSWGCCPCPCSRHTKTFLRLPDCQCLESPCVSGRQGLQISAGHVLWLQTGGKIDATGAWKDVEKWKWMASLLLLMYLIPPTNMTTLPVFFRWGADDRFHLDLCFCNLGKVLVSLDFQTLLPAMGSLIVAQCLLLPLGELWSLPLKFFEVFRRDHLPTMSCFSYSHCDVNIIYHCGK